MRFHFLCSVVGSRDNRPYQGLFFPPALVLALDQNDSSLLFCAIDAFPHVELFTLAGSPNGYI